MKLVDAYLDKQNYKLSSKQFLKVLKKAPYHLPAHIGYVMALERIGRTKQLCTVALAYGNATKIAIQLGVKGDDGVEVDVNKVGDGEYSERNKGGMAEAILRRALTVAKSCSKYEEKMMTLVRLSEIAHTYVLAADVYYLIGLEIVQHGTTTVEDGEGEMEEAMQAFEVANAFIRHFMLETATTTAEGEDDDDALFYHAGSMLELGKIALSREDNVKEGIEYVEKALRKSDELEEDGKVEALVLLGQAKQSMGDLDGSIQNYKLALDLPSVGKSTAKAHHQLGIALLTKKKGGDNNVKEQDIENHFEQALELGMDPTPEAIAVLSEHNIHVMRSVNRAQWDAYNKAMESEKGGGSGGIMSGGGLGSSSQSVFAPQKETVEQEQQAEDALSLLEQGAVAYDGNVPTGGEGDSSLGAVHRRSSAT
uniref:Uncharacterized protein n=1 Tax=Ditylum brightwellii TaxID=49249 RepID=A0A7S4VMC8_9STRA